jgi:hypothetical protein
MARKHDTDTLTPVPETEWDGLPDAPTIRQDATASEDPTHRLEPRVYAPLRVCPQCSLAWEITGDWCPSCGTAFDKTRRESSTPTRVMQHAPAAVPPRTTSAPPRRARAAASPASERAARPRGSGGALRSIFTVLVICAVAVVAFLAGQATRPSSAQVDRRVNDAVSTAKQSAAASYERAFNKMQEQAAAAIERARAEGVASAEQQARQQADASRGILDSVTACVLHGNC